MSFKRFVGNTSKEAMAQARRALGDEAVILSNRRLPGGQIEILAAASDAVEAIVEDLRRPKPAAPRKGAPPVETFQDYLRRQSPPAPAAQRSTARPATINVPLDRPARGAAAAAAGSAATHAAQYRAVGAAPHDDDEIDDFSGFEELGWADSRFDASLMPAPTPARLLPTRNAPAATGGSAGSARPATVDMPLPEPAVFRRRPSRESAAPPSPAVGPVLGPVVGSMSDALAAPPVAAAPVAASPSVAVAAAAPAASAPAVAAVAAVAAAPVIAPPVVAAALPPAASPATEIRLPVVDAAAQASAQLMAELHSLRSALQEQLHALSNTVTASDASRRHPAQARLMTRLLTAGFSADVARRIALNAPVQADAATADAWLQDVLALNLRCAQAGDSIIERGGQAGCSVYALVGPTGVGKTTTVAKLAARFAVKYGAQGLGLVTLDGYRVAAHEQLRTYGRILGAPVHLAQDGATLRELLASMQNKKLVLIDTCGVGPRDERLPEMLNTLALAGGGERKVQPVLLLNAASHAETLDDNARAWRAGEAAGTILTKLDEAARIGGALDCALRWKLTLLGLTNGQRVPEDLHLPNARLLAHLALKPAHQLFALAEAEGALLAQAARGALHA